MRHSFRGPMTSNGSIQTSRPMTGRRIWRAGLPPTLIGAMSRFVLATAWGFYGTVTPVVEESTGRKPAFVRDFVIANKAAFTNAG